MKAPPANPPLLGPPIVTGALAEPQLALLRERADGLFAASPDLGCVLIGHAPAVGGTCRVDWVDYFDCAGVSLGGAIDNRDARRLGAGFAWAALALERHCRGVCALIHNAFARTYNDRNVGLVIGRGAMYFVQPLDAFLDPECYLLERLNPTWDQPIRPLLVAPPSAHERLAIEDDARRTLAHVIAGIEAVRSDPDPI